MLKGSKLLIPRLPVSALQPRTCWSKMSGLTSPICPKFIPVEDGENVAMNKSSGSRFRLVSYNILAQVYVKSSLFPHSPSSCLRWRARSHAIMTVLKSFEADFLCIQELDEFDSFYKGNMEKHGYSNVYIQRSGQKRDGCGIFYKPGSAELVLKEEIEYNDLVNLVTCGSTIDGNGNENLLDIKVARDMPVEDSQNKSCSDDRGDLSDPRVRLKRDCVGILAAFKLNDPSHHVVVVANTHIYWDPKLADVKLAQAEHLLLRLSQFKEVISKEYSCIPSIIVAGDFNSTPGDKVYQCLVSGLPISLCSFYAHIREEPPFTNCTPDFTGTLDYVFFSNNSRLKPVSFLEIPGPDSPNVLGGLPNYLHPSDHLPIGGDFEVTDT